MISEGIGAGVGDVVRETVETCQRHWRQTAPASERSRKKLGIDKSNASRRVRRAADGGYIRNLEDKRGRPGRWVVGEPLPETVEILPLPDTIKSPPQHATPRNAESRGIPGCCAVAPVHEGIQAPPDFDEGILI